MSDVKIPAVEFDTSSFFPAFEMPAEQETVVPAEEHPTEKRGDSRLDEILAKTPWWAISIAFHTVVLLIMWVWKIHVPEQVVNEIIIEARIEQKEEPEYDPEVKRDLVKRDMPLVETELEVEMPVVTMDVEAVDDHFETDSDMDTDTAQGFEDAIGFVDAGSVGLVSSIGVGGGGKGGRYGFRGGGGKKHALRRGGGGQGTEDAVDAALRWLARHQEDDGHWDVAKHGGFNSVSGGNCVSDTAVSGLAVLAFLGAGHTNKTGKYKDNVDRAVKWLMSKQLPSGAFIRDGSGYEVYDHTIGTLALAEAYGMSLDREIGGAAQAAVEYVQKIQEPYSGWHHGSYRSTSVLGWGVMAIKSAKIAGLKVNEESFQGALNRLREITDQNDYGKVGYTAKGQYPYGKGFAMTSVGMASYMFLGVKPTDPMIQMQADLLVQEPPQWKPGCGVGDMQYFYHWYYATLGMFQVGGGHWKTWNKALKETLLPNQRKGGDEDGSWDFDAGWGPAGGRVYSTALGALCLEVYYRYMPLYR